VNFFCRRKYKKPGCRKHPGTIILRPGRPLSASNSAKLLPATRHLVILSKFHDKPEIQIQNHVAKVQTITVYLNEMTGSIQSNPSLFMLNMKFGHLLLQSFGQFCQRLARCGDFLHRRRLFFGRRRNVLRFSCRIAAEILDFLD